LFPRANKARKLTVYKAKAGKCEACKLRPKCTDNKTGCQVLRYFTEAYVDRVRSYPATFPYE
jgi:Transposase DDE domain